MCYSLFILENRRYYSDSFLTFFENLVQLTHSTEDSNILSCSSRRTAPKPRGIGLDENVLRIIAANRERSVTRCLVSSSMMNRVSRVADKMCMSARWK